MGQNKYAAEPLLLKGYEGLKQCGKALEPRDGPRVAESLDRPIELYTATNKPDEVEKREAEQAKYPVELALPPRGRRSVTSSPASGNNLPRGGGRSMWTRRVVDGERVHAPLAETEAAGSGRWRCVTHKSGAKTRLVEAARELFAGVVERFEVIARQYQAPMTCRLEEGAFVRLVLDVVARTRETPPGLTPRRSWPAWCWGGVEEPGRGPSALGRGQGPYGDAATARRERLKMPLLGGQRHAEARWC